MKTHILYIGLNAEINIIMQRLINGHDGWEGFVAASGEEAILLFHQHTFDVVLLGNGMDEEEERKLRAIFTRQHPDVIIIEHYGGGSGLLENEIREALDNRKPGLNFQDNF